MTDALPASTPMTVGAPTYPPLAHAALCARSPAICAADSAGSILPALTEAAWRDLAVVNRTVNKAIRPRADIAVTGLADVWSVGPSEGDCEDYALTKREALLARGWPRAALVVAVVRDPSLQHHAVLIARTRSGDFVLDNLGTVVRPWAALPYRWIKRQSAEDPRRWVQLDGYVEDMIARRDEKLRRLTLREADATSSH